MGDFPSGKAVLSVYKGLKEINGISPIAVGKRALCAEPIAAWRPGGGGHAVGCGGWLGPIINQIRGKAEELDSLLLFAIRVVEAGRPGHRLQLLPLRSRRLAIAFETSKLLAELEEVDEKW
jgi:hypothetical protein